MHNTLELIQLADVMHADRSAMNSGVPTQERSPTLRPWVGRRLIALGERLARTKTAAAAR